MADKPVSAGGRAGNPAKWCLPALFVLGAVLRLSFLGTPLLWIDEITVRDFATVDKTPGAIIAEIQKAGFKGFTGQHMPFQYVWLNLFLHLYKGVGAEAGEFLVRLPFALLGILSIPVFYRVAASVYGRRAGLWAAGLCAVSFFHVYQSRDATSYAPLVFFLALNLWGLVRLAVARSEGRGKILGAALFLAGSIGALFTHLTAWLFLAAEGGILALAVLASALKPSPTKKANYFAGTGHLFLPIALLAVSCAPFLSFILAASRDFTTGQQTQGAVDAFTWAIPAYQLAHFGWGRGAGRLLAFGLFALAGAVAVVRDRARRRAGAGHLWLVLVPAALFFFFLRRDFFPRYLAVSFFPLVALAAAGVDASIEAAAGRLRKMPFARPVLSIAVCVLLAAWLAGPYRVLFAMRDKLMPMSSVRDWVTANTPEGGLYVWRNGYHSREVPGVYAIPGRQAGAADYPNAGIPDEEYLRRSRVTRSIFVRFPEAVLINDEDFDTAKWNWILTDFARQEVIGDDTLARLWAWGLSPHGLNTPRGIRFTGCRHAEDAIVRRALEAAPAAAWPVGPSWTYAQVQDGTMLAAPKGTADVRFVRRPGSPTTWNLRIRGAATQPGSVTASVAGAGGAGGARTVPFPQGSSLDIKLGPFELEPEQALITISQFPGDRVALLAYSFEPEPAVEQRGN